MILHQWIQPTTDEKYPRLPIQKVSKSTLAPIYIAFTLLLSFSCSVVSDSLWPHGLQHSRPPCPSPTPRVDSDSCPLSQWWHPSNHLIFCCPFLLPPSIFPSIRVFSNESDLHIRWPKEWSFSFNISPSNEYSGLISFRMDWLDLLAVRGTLKNLLQHHSSKHKLFGAQLSLWPNTHPIHDYWKNHIFG